MVNWSVTLPGNHILFAFFENTEIYAKEGIEIRTPYIATTAICKFLSPVHFVVHNFFFKGLLQAPGVKITSKRYALGEEGRDGEIQSSGKLEVESDTIDNRWGKAFGKTGVQMLARTGNITVGASLKGKGPFTYSRNEAFVSADGPMDLQAPKGDILIDYGTLFASGLMNLEALNLIRVKTGIVWGRAGGRFKAKKFEATREAQSAIKYSQCVKHGRGSWSSNEWTLNTEQSDEARIEFTKEKGNGNFFLEVLEATVLASTLRVAGALNVKGINIATDSLKSYESFFKVLNRHDSNRGVTNNSLVTALGNVVIDTSKVAVTGGINSGANVHISVEDFFAENTTNQRTNGPRTTLVFNILELAKQFAETGGIFKDFGQDTKGSRYGISIPVEEEAKIDPAMMTIIGGSAESKKLLQIMVSPLFLKWCVREIATRLCGAAALDETFIEKLVKNSEDKKDQIKTYEDLVKQTESMLVFEFNKVTNTVKNVRSIEELVPHLVIAPVDQNPHLLDSGYIGAGQTAQIEASRDATLLSAMVEAEDIKLHAKRNLELRRKKYTVVIPIENGVKIQEIAAPPITLIGRNSVSAIGDQSYYAEGIHSFSGKGGGIHGSTYGPSTTNATTCTTTTHQTRHESGGLFGSDKTHHITRMDQTVLPSVYQSEGKLTNLSGKDQPINFGGVESYSEKSIKFEGGSVNTRGAVDRHSVSESVDKQGFVRNSHLSSHSESVGCTPDKFVAPKLKINTITGDMRAAHIQMEKVIDNTENLKIGMRKETVRSSQSTRRSQHIGMPGVSWGERTVEQEVGFPSILLVDEWQSIGGENLIFESVLGHKIRKFICKDKKFKMETATLNRRETTSQGSCGFNAPGINQPLQDPLASASQGFRFAENNPDRIAAGIRLGTEGLKAFNQGYHLCKGGNPFKALLERYVSISLNLNISSSKTEQSVAQPNVLNCEVMILDNEHSHLEGIVNAKEIYLLTKKLTGAPMQSTLKHESHSTDVGVTWTYGSLVPSSVSYQQTDHKVEQISHQNTQINADEIFLRIDDMLFSGVNLQAKLVDAVINNQLTLESVLDWFKEDFSSIGGSVGLSGVDLRVENRDKEIAKINQIASLVGTQQFYLKVGKKLIARSAEFGLQPDGMKPPKLINTDGDVFFIRPMPDFNNDAGFHALLTCIGSRKPREDALTYLRDSTDDDLIRQLVAPEIKQAMKDGTIAHIAGADGLDNQRIVAESELDEAVAAANRQLGTKGQTASQLLALDPEGKDMRLERLRQASADFNAITQKIDTWAEDSRTYIDYINKHVATPGYRLDCSPTASDTGVMDALAQLCCLNLEVSQKHPITGLLEVQHRYPLDAALEDVKLVQTGFHFDRLEETDEKVDAEEIIREKLEEYERGDSNVINIPMASAIGFIGQLNEFQAVVADAYHFLTVERGLPSEEALDTINQKGLENGIIHRLQELGATPDDIQTILKDQAIGDVVVRSDLFQKGKGAPTVEVVIGGRAYKSSQETPLETVLDISKRAALAFDDFSSRHPTLTHLGFEALQMAMGGPAYFLRDKVFTAVGLHDATEYLADQAKNKVRDYLVNNCNFTPFNADVSAEAGQFGLMFAASAIGSIGKDKVFKSAKNVAEKVKFKATKDQPWNIRPGQEWKEKIVGKGQKTGTDGHVLKSYKEAVGVAKKKEVTEVLVDRGINRLLPKGSKIKPNRRPDVAYKTSDGKIHQIEVPSKTDNIRDLNARMQETRNRLPDNSQGETLIRNIKKSTNGNS
jgi:hypothetical protein